MVPFRGKRVLKWNIDIHPSKTSNLCLLRVDSFVVDDVHALTVGKKIKNNQKGRKKIEKDFFSLIHFSFYAINIFMWNFYLFWPQCKSNKLLLDNKCHDRHSSKNWLKCCCRRLCSWSEALDWWNDVLVPSFGTVKC